VATDDEPADDEQIKRVIESTGLDISGGLAGAAAGVLIGGPPGAVAGAFVAPAVRSAFGVIARRLGRRETVRVMTAIGVAAEEVQRLLDAGEVPRSDGFFDAGDRPAAEEIAEGVLLGAQREYEEAKVPYLGRMLARIAFDETINRETANHLIRLMNDLSYEQIMLLMLYSQRALNREEDYHPERVPRPSVELITVLSETYDLYQRGLINNGGDAALSMLQLKPARIEIQGVGTQLARTSFPQYIEDSGQLNRLSRVLRRD
jgi:hypothetical protein